MGLSLNLLGELTIRDSSGRGLSLPTRKSRALLAYLAVNADRAQPRERLAGLLWSDRSEQQARRSLSQALMAIRKLDGGMLLESDGEQVTLRSDAAQCDVQRFRLLLRNQPAEAAALYGGPFLDGFSVPDPAFEEWQLAMRSELQALACDALQRAADDAAELGETNRAIDHARRLAALDPLREEAHRCLMRLLYQAGDRASALRQYQACADILKRELQVEPDAATKALFSDITENRQTDAQARLSPGTLDAPPLPDKPSIAILPFDNLGNDPAQNIFGDGMAEDIITELSRFHSLFVIARGSSFAFKGQAIETRKIARKLGVRYMVEGSVRTHDARIRVTAQLIDAETGNHLWANRYDRRLDDTFAVQDELTSAIVLAIAPQIDRSELLRAQRKPPQSVDAWSLYQHGMTTFYQTNETGLRSAASLFDRASEADPTFATAYAYAAAARNRLAINLGPNDAESLLAEARERLDTALAIDPMNVVAHFVTGVSESLDGNHTLAVDHVRQAIEQNPNSAFSHMIMCYVLRHAGRPAEAIEAVDQALRLSPYDPGLPIFLSNKTNALFELMRYEDCIEWGRRATSVPSPLPGAFLSLAAALVCLNRLDEARHTMDKLNLRFPKYSPRSSTRVMRKNSWEIARIRCLEILQEAGLVKLGRSKDQ